MRAPVLKDGALELIGNTPLVRFRHVCPNPNVEIWAKLESANPGGSVKDRIAKSMIEAAEASGDLSKDKTILEATSGNTGIGLALVGGMKGYKVLLAMSEAVSQERCQILSALGADFLRTPARLGADLNVPMALGVIFILIRSVNPLLARKGLSEGDASTILLALDKINSVLGFLDLNPANSETEDPEIEALVSRREEARDRKDYEEADRIREELKKKNVVLEDTAYGTLHWIETRPPKE